MKAYKVIYRNGHFIDIDTNKRIIPTQSSEYTIEGDDDAFVSEDEKLTLHESLNPEEKLASVLGKYGEGNVLKILPRGIKLFFRVGNSRSLKSDPSNQYLFTCVLLEDLFIYRINEKDGKKDLDWRLAPCNCQLEDCIFGNLTLSEKLKAESLNRLFSNTVMFYFSLQRSAAINVFIGFFLYHPKMMVSIDLVFDDVYKSLANIRALALKNLWNSDISMDDFVPDRFMNDTNYTMEATSKTIKESWLRNGIVNHH